jgi:predicted secreted protein
MDTSIGRFSIPTQSTVLEDVRTETLLTEVHIDDHVIIKNVFATIDTMRPFKLVHQYKIVCTKKGYDVIGILSKPSDRGAATPVAANGTDVIISVQDLDMIMNMNPARIATCIVQIPCDAPAQLVVRVLRSDQAIVYNNIQVSHVQKKLRWW